MKIAIYSVVCLVAFCSTGKSQAPKNGPAKDLYITNSSGIDATITVMRQNGDTTYLTSVVLLDGKDYTFQLIQGYKGDRVVLASSTGKQEWKFYDAAGFNAASQPFPVVGMTLEKDQETGELRLKMLLQGGGNAGNPNKADKTIKESSTPVK